VPSGANRGKTKPSKALYAEPHFLIANFFNGIDPERTLLDGANRRRKAHHFILNFFCAGDILRMISNPASLQ